MESIISEKQSVFDEWDVQGATCIAFANDDGCPADEPYIDGPLARSEFDLPDGPLLRFQAYRRAWDKCLCRVKEIVHDLYSPVVHAVVDSVQAAYTNSDGVVLPLPELVSLVVSSSDRTNLHEVLSRISTSLCGDDASDSEEGTESGLLPGAFISRLSELDCPNVAATMRNLIGGFISQSMGKGSSPKIKTSSSLAGHDLNLLKAWYQMMKETHGVNAPALVVLIQDLHTIDSVILRDVFEICSFHLPHLPLVFILGTSDPDLLPSLLPRKTLACLRLDKHILPWNAKALEHVIRETFFSLKFTPDVMLGPVGFQKIFEDFKRDNGTLDAVLSTLQLLHIQHFYNPLSLIIDAASETILYEVNESPPEECMPFFKLLRRYSLSSLLGAPKMEDRSEWSELMPQEIIQTVFGARNTFHERANGMKLALNVLESILTFSRAHGKKTPAISFENIGLDALRGSLGSNGAQSVPNIMKQLNSNEVKALLEELYRLLHNLPAYLRKHANELKEKVVFVQNSAIEEVLEGFMDYLKIYFKKVLISFEDISCLDLWWTGEMTVPHSPLNPNPHMSVVTALLQPYQYLGWTLSTNSGRKLRRELSSLPDACILFRRYVESGKMINVYDWFDSFSVALESEALEEGNDHTMDVDDSPSKGKGKKANLKRKKPDEEAEEERKGARKREVQARFMRAMHELEFVGFLKHTGRKPDHVTKTVFDVLD